MTAPPPRYVTDVEVAEEFVVRGTVHLQAGETVTANRVEQVLADLGLLSDTRVRPQFRCTHCKEGVRFHKTAQRLVRAKGGEKKQERVQPAYFQRIARTHRKPCYYALSHKERAEYEREQERRPLPMAPTRLLPPILKFQGSAGAGDRTQVEDGSGERPEETAEMTARSLVQIYNAFWERVHSLQSPNRSDIEHALDGLRITLPDGIQHDYAEAFSGLMLESQHLEGYRIWFGRLKAIRHHADGVLLHMVPVQGLPLRSGLVVLERERLDELGQWGTYKPCCWVTCGRLLACSYVLRERCLWMERTFW